MKTKHIKISNRTASKLRCILAASITAFLGLSGLAQGQTFQFWDGSNTIANGIIDGGDGFWSSSMTNWTNADGSINSFYDNDPPIATAVFAGTAAGTVTVKGNIFVSDLEFRITGYTIEARTGKDGLILDSASMITTDPGVTATISASLHDPSEIGAGGAPVAGGIIKEGEGTLVLSGINFYHGATVVNGGTLSISSDANLGIAPNPSPTPIADQLTFNGGTLQVTASFELDTNRGITLLGGGGTIGVTAANILTYGGVITGAGSLTKTDTGTLVLSGMNTYTGATAVNGGTLSISSDANLGAAPGAPVGDRLTFDGGTLRVTDSFELDTNRGITLLGGGGTIGVTAANILTYGGVITGAGSLTKTDTGTLFLSGMNTYAGATTVNGGTLVAGAINTFPSQTALTVATGATVVLGDFNQSIGSLAGAGSVTLGAARLTAGNDGTSTDFSGVISGLGGLTKVGTGTQILSGENTYTGSTTVDAGSLLVDGSIGAGLTSVNLGGLLGGGGTIGGSVLNRGTVSPGNSPGTLTIDGDYTQTTSGTLLIEVAGLGMTEHDLLVVNGTATLAGTLKVIRLNGFHFLPGEQITLLTAGVALKGKFKPVENAFITGTIVESHIVYDRLSDPKSVILNLTQGLFRTVCTTPNDIAVGTALDSAVGDPRAAGLIEFLDTVPLPELCDDLDLIAPPDIASIFNIGVSLANIQTANLERRMDDIRAGSRGFSASGFTINGSTPNYSGGLAGPTGPEGKSGPSVMQPTPENRWGVFVTGLGEFTNVDNTSNARGFDLTTGGFTLGVDYRVCSNFAIGLTGGYAHTNAELANNGNLGVNGGTIGLYATAFSGGFYADAAATGGFNNYDSDRTALLGTAKGSTDGADFTALLAGGYDWKIGGLSIGPVANFQYTYVSFDGFTESGSIAPLKFNSQNADSTRTSIGLKTSYDWKVGSVLVRPEIRAAWQHEFGDSEYSIVSRFANGAGSSFTVNGPAIGPDSLLIGAGAAVLLNDRVSIYAYYDGELARTNYISNNVSAGLRVTF